MKKSKEEQEIFDGIIHRQIEGWSGKLSEFKKKDIELCMESYHNIKSKEEQKTIYLYVSNFGKKIWKPYFKINAQHFHLGRECETKKEAFWYLEQAKIALESKTNKIIILHKTLKGFNTPKIK